MAQVSSIAYILFTDFRHGVHVENEIVQSFDKVSYGDAELTLVDPEVILDACQACFGPHLSDDDDGMLTTTVVEIKKMMNVDGLLIGLEG